jgi:Pheophorbide a oxygenase
VTNKQPAPQGGWQTAIVLFVVPIKEGYSRLITTFDTLKPHPWTPDWILHMINRWYVDLHLAGSCLRHVHHLMDHFVYFTGSSKVT